jgi:hypothetical protein
LLFDSYLNNQIISCDLCWCVLRLGCHVWLWVMLALCRCKRLGVRVSWKWCEKDRENCSRGDEKGDFVVGPGILKVLTRTESDSSVITQAKCTSRNRSKNIQNQWNKVFWSLPP